MIERRTAERYIQVAIGRDYADVPPIRGLYKGAASNQLMTVDLSIVPIDESQTSISHSSSQDQQ